MVKRVVTGARYGLRDWLAQRITAVFMALYSVLFAGAMMIHAPWDFAKWKMLFGANFVRIMTLIFFLCVFYHAWVGVRDIFMDYIKHTGLRFALQVMVIFLLLAYTIWSISILWSV